MPVGAEGCHLNLFSVPQWKVSCKWSLLWLSLQLQSLLHCGSVRVWWNKKEWIVVADGREYTLRNFMTYCVQTQNRAGGLCSHERTLSLCLTIRRNKDGSWWASKASLLLSAQAFYSTWITNSCLISGGKLISPNTSALFFQKRTRTVPPSCL